MKGFLKNWELKILALLSAIVLWFFVVGIENNSYRFPDDLDIQALNVPQGMSVTNDLGKAKIRIRADQEVITNLVKSDFDLSVDLRKAQEGEQQLPVIATSKNVKVTILKVDPATVRVVLEPVTQKEIKVKAVVSGNPAKGYSVEAIEVSPATVQISGGKTLLSTLTAIDARVKLDGTESTNFKQNVILKIPDTISPLQNVTLGPEQVTVEITIKQDLQQKTVPVKPNLQGSVDLIVLSQKLIVSPETVTIQGKEEILNAIKEISTEPVNLDTLKNSTTPVKVKLILPSGVSIPDSQPNAVSISLTAPQ